MDKKWQPIETAPKDGTWINSTSSLAGEPETACSAPDTMNAGGEHSPVAGASGSTGDLVKHMTERFLGWKLPENFNPDNGIKFDRVGNLGTEHQYYREPIGTNLFDYTQAEAMVRHLLEGAPIAGVPETHATYDKSTHVAVRKMTESEFREWFSTKPTFSATRQGLRDLGIIPDPNPIDTAAANNNIPPDALRAALKELGL